MEKIDMRKLNSDELYMKRKEVVRLKQTKHTGKETAEIAEISEDQVTCIPGYHHYDVFIMYAVQHFSRSMT